METAKPEVKLALLQALARRGDKSSVSVFITAAKDADEAVRVAALAGLGTVGNPSAVPLLLQAAAGGGEPQEAARQSLQSLPGADIDQAILAALTDKDAKIRVEAVRALAARHVVAATGSLLKAVDDADGEVRNESLKALGNVAPAEARAALTSVLVKTTDDGVAQRGRRRAGENRRSRSGHRNPLRADPPSRWLVQRSCEAFAAGGVGPDRRAEVAGVPARGREG